MQVPGSAEYTAALVEFIETAQKALGPLFTLCFGADNGVCPQPLAFLSALSTRDEHVLRVVQGSRQLEPVAGSGVKVTSDVNVLLDQSWQRHGNALLACYLNPAFLKRSDCPRIVGGRGPCSHWSEVDPLFNYDRDTNTFVASATRLLQGALARDATQDKGSTPYSIQWRNGLTVSDADQTRAYSLPSQHCLQTSYAHMHEELGAAEGLCGKVSIHDVPTVLLTPARTSLPSGDLTCICTRCAKWAGCVGCL